MKESDRQPTCLNLHTGKKAPRVRQREIMQMIYLNIYAHKEALRTRRTESRASERERKKRICTYVEIIRIDTDKRPSALKLRHYVVLLRRNNHSGLHIPPEADKVGVNT